MILFRSDQWVSESAGGGAGWRPRAGPFARGRQQARLDGASEARSGTPHTPKISKSNGVTVDPATLAEEYGTDAVRWWLVREVPHLGDADVTLGRLVARTATATSTPGANWTRSWTRSSEHAGQSPSTWHPSCPTPRPASHGSAQPWTDGCPTPHRSSRGSPHRSGDDCRRGSGCGQAASC
ncbi:class I tRNA ligase family protein [Sphaerisporangium sp. NPDC088356]|uniref:class I tRNA ligase family protein n=1 Tax=Sphaerisporangium sp. NPDC088356 TaxID=3154871 RepID=UPI00341A248B